MRDAADGYGSYPDALSLDWKRSGRLDSKVPRQAPTFPHGPVRNHSRLQLFTGTIKKTTGYSLESTAQTGDFIHRAELVKDARRASHEGNVYGFPLYINSESST